MTPSSGNSRWRTLISYQNFNTLKNSIRKYTMDNQYETLILRNPKAAKQNTPKEVVKRHTHMVVKDVDVETNPIKQVTGDLKKKVIAARLAYMEEGSTKPGVTQERLAQLAKVKAADIKLLEQGKMDLKQAKQIALCIERHLKVKIL